LLRITHFKAQKLHFVFYNHPELTRFFLIFPEQIPAESTLAPLLQRLSLYTDVSASSAFLAQIRQCLLTRNTDGNCFEQQRKKIVTG